ncbi:hypothetical protein [Rhabdochlamydiaceae symbiont of Dictyostelium giganteum]|uniref:hypothetical protein n=1 Tax=Rhabdochlamydiaceae symbiont of Dictyostelium giganteum TaxID=3342349 RepID=UPI00384D7582
MQNFSQRLFFCHSTMGKIKSLQSTHLGEPSAQKMDTIDGSFSRQVHALSNVIQDLSKSAEYIKEAERLINYQTCPLTIEEVIRIQQLMTLDEIKGSLKEKLQQRFNDDLKNSLNEFYKDPKLDAYIQSHQGKIENIEEFNINNLAHRAKRGDLDFETSQKIFKKIKDELDATNQQVLEENKSGLTGYEGLWDLDKKERR